MQTQCPHCDTRFRVTETQVNTADGFVRCSVCKEVFNAFEVAAQHKHQSSLLEGNHSDDELPTVEADNNIFDTGTHDDSNLTQSGEASDTSLDEAENAITHTSWDEFDNDAPHQTDENIDFNATSTTDESRKDAFDFFDEDSNKSLSHVVPDHYRDSHHSSRATVTSGIFWGIGIILLSSSLFAEYLWFNRNQPDQFTQLQIWADELCQQVECEGFAMRDPSQIELVTRNVYSHPNEKNALMVNVTMKNNAQFAQPLPVMQINFSDVRGGTIAARRFLPTEYLPTSDKQDAEKLYTLQPDTNISFTLEIQDPGKQALTYEFTFL